MQRRDLTPALLSMLLLLAIAALAVVRPGRIAGIWSHAVAKPDTLMIGGYMVWIALEAPVARRDAGSAGKAATDGATCQIYAFSQAATVLSALWFAPLWHSPQAAHPIGMALFLAGAAYRMWAVRMLGVYYSHRVRRAAVHAVVDSGPYRFVRHPAYAGMIAAHGGVSLYFFNGVTAGLLLLALVPSILRRIVIEERMLFGIPGYAAYARTRKRLCPGIW
jgi:protein-S-isoprenylcysteine O-methyltransferase Ste14